MDIMYPILWTRWSSRSPMCVGGVFSHFFFFFLFFFFFFLLFSVFYASVVLFYCHIWCVCFVFMFFLVVFIACFVTSSALVFCVCCFCLFMCSVGPFRCCLGMSKGLLLLCCGRCGPNLFVYGAGGGVVVFLFVGLLLKTLSLWAGLCCVCFSYVGRLCPVVGLRVWARWLLGSVCSGGVFFLGIWWLYVLRLLWRVMVSVAVHSVGRVFWLYGSRFPL